MMANKILLCRFFYWIALLFCIGLLGCNTGQQSSQDQTQPDASEIENSFYSFKINNLDGWPIPLSRYQGKVILVVNVASECRFTHQYSNLQKLYKKYKDQEFVVLGFPTNDFGRQEPGSDAEIKEFITEQFNITFPVFSKIHAKGKRIHPLYQYLTSEEINGEFGGPITWNFEKILIDKEGTTIARFPSNMDPLDTQITKAIEAALQ